MNDITVNDEKVDECHGGWVVGCRLGSSRSMSSGVDFGYLSHVDQRRGACGHWLLQWGAVHRGRIGCC